RGTPLLRARAKIPKPPSWPVSKALASEDRSSWMIYETASDRTEIPFGQTGNLFTYPRRLNLLLHVPVTGADVNHGCVDQFFALRPFEIIVSPPKVLLLRSFFEQDGFFIAMKFSPDTDHLKVKVYDKFHHIFELRIGQPANGGFRKRLIKILRRRHDTNYSFMGRV